MKTQAIVGRNLPQDKMNVDMLEKNNNWKTGFKLVFLCLLAIFTIFSTPLNAATKTSTAAGGLWSSTLTWVGGAVPAAGDTAIIATTGAGNVSIATSITQISTGSVTIKSAAILNMTSTGVTVSLGALTINSGGTFNVNRNLTILGATSISGTINFASTSGTARTMTFSGDVTLNSGTVWTEPATGNGSINIYNFSGNFTNNATTFSALGTEVHTFRGTGKTLSGSTTTSIPRVTFSTGASTNAGTLSVGTLLTVTTVALTNTGTITATTALSGTGSVVQGATGILNIGGTSGITTLTATAAGNNVNYTGVAQTVKSTNYYHLTLGGSGIKTLQTGTTTIGGNLTLSATASTTTVANLSIGGNLTVGTGTTFTQGAAYTLGVTGTTGITGTYTDGSTGTKTLTGDVTLNAGAVWNETAVSAYTIAGNFTNNATTFTPNTGVHTFSGASKTLSGSTITSIPNAAFTGSYTNANTLTVTTALSGAGTLTQATSALLNIAGTAAVTTLAASVNVNTVNYTGTVQTINSGNYYHLNLTGSGAKTFQSGTTSIVGNLTLTGTISATTAANLTIGGNLDIGTGTSFITASTFSLGVSGTTNITGTYTDGSTGAKSFTGDITLNAGSVWNETAISAYTIVGNITNNATTFTANSGVHTFSGSAKSLNGSTISSIPSVTISGSYTNNNSLTIGTALAGGGSLTEAANSTLNLGGTSTISTLNATNSGNTVNFAGAGQTVYNSNYYHLVLSGSGTKTFQTGTTTIAGNLSTTGTITATTVVGLAIGGYVNIGLGTTFAGGSYTHNITGNWSNTGTFTGGTSTINLAGASQIITGNTTFNNLTFGGSGGKTIAAGTALTVNGILSIENGGNANTFSGTLAYGAAGTLKYNSTTALTASTEWITPFTATGGVLIAGTGELTLNTDKVLNSSVPLTINANASLNTDAANNRAISLGGNFSNSGTFTANASAVTISGTMTTQSISGFSTTAAVSVTKTAGTATLLGNVNASTLTVNGTGGTLNLGSGLTHTLSGDVSLSAGTLNGGSSTLTLNSTSATAWTGTGSNFSAGTGSVSFSGANQTINTATTFYNLVLGGTGTKTFTAATTTSSNFLINKNVIVNLGTGLTHSSQYLYFAGVNQTGGAGISWGGTGATVTYLNTTYFAASTGKLNVSATSACGTNTWSGTLSTDWNNASNWCGGIPTAITSVLIPSAATRQPTISSAAVCDGITIQSGATLTISGTNTLNVYGDWSNNGTFTANSSTVIFSDPVGQIISGSSTTTFNNLTLTLGGVVTLTTVPTVNGILSMEGSSVSTAPAFGAAATLQYNTANAFSTGSEWISPFIATGGVIIKNIGLITLSGAKQLGNSTNVALNINANAKLATANYGLIFNGDFINAGTFTAGSSAITVDGTVSAQNIAGLTTLGGFICNKSAGTATLTGSLNAATLTNNTAGGTLHLGTGLTHTITGAWTRTNGTVNGGSGTLNIGGSVTNSAGAFTTGTSTINYNGTAQTTASINYYNLTLAGSGTKTMQSGTTSIGNIFTLSGTAAATTAANLSVTGNMTIGSGTSLATASTFTLGVTGTTNITGTYTDGSTGAKSFTGDITLNAGSVWNETAISSYSIAGNLTNNATTFTGNTGVHTFSGSSKTLSGSTAISIPNTTISGSYTNNGTLTVSTALSGAGSIIQGTGSILNIGGTSGITTLTATTNVNTVNYTGATQTVHSNNYSSLTLSGSAAKTLQSGTTSILSNFSLSGTATATAVTGLTIGANVNIGSGTTFIGGAYTHNIAGNWTKTGTFTATGSTINFNGTSAQSIGTSNFNHLIFSASGTATATGALSIVGNLSISSNFSAGSYTHSLQGNWTNNGTFTGNTSTISLTGAGAQTIAGTNPTTFYNVTQNGTGLVTLGITTTVSGTLAMTLGNIDISSYNLTVGSTSGGSAASYVQTTGTGRLVQYVDYNITKTFPIGKSAYNPAIVRNNTSGGGDSFYLGVSDDAITNANDNTKSVNRKWYLYKNNVGTANVTLSFTYNSVEGQTNFNAGTYPKLGLFSGTFWNYTPATVNGTTFSATGNITNVNTTNQFIAMGSDNVFDASKFGLTIDPATPVRNSASTVVTVQSQNSSGIPTYVLSDVPFTLSATNTTLLGTPTGTITTGTYQTTVNAVTLNSTTWNAPNQVYDAIATLTATQTSGLVGTSDGFAVIDAAIYEPITTENWVATDGWRKSTDGGSTWINPVKLPSNNDFSETDVIRIPSGITLTADTTATFFSMLVYGSLNISSSGSLTINHNVVNGLDNDYNLHVEGTLQNSGGTLTNTDIAYPIDIHGGKYIHAMNGGNIPVASWVTNGGVPSTCQITGITSTPLTGLNQTFENFSWNNSSQSVIQYLDGDMAVSDTLRLTNGVITTTANHIIEAASGSLIRTNGYVNGNFRLYVPDTTAPTVIFPIGDATHYAPISISFAGTVSGSGYLDTYTTVAQPPFASGLSQTKYINRKWNIENNAVSGFTSYNATFTCNDNDKVGSPTLANLVVRKLNGSTWYTTSTTTPSSNAITCTGLTGFSDFYIGESDCSSTNAMWLGSIGTDWNTAGNWCNNAVPTSTSNVTIPAGITNYPVIGSTGGTCNNITIINGASLSTSGAYSLDVKGNWNNNGTFTSNSGTVSFTGTSAQSISGQTTFNNLTINNAAGVTATSNLSVNSTLTLSSVNPDATHGTLDMGSFTLSMLSASATVSGTGDVSGTIKRTHTFSSNIQYSFGSQYTTMTFLGVGTQPDELTCKITLGTALSVGGTANTFVQRNYIFSQTGIAGTDRVAVNLHYLASELNGQDETKLVLWDHHPSDGRTEEHGKTNNSTTNKWVGLSGLTISYLAPAPTSSSYNKQLGLSNYTTTKKTWTGASNTNWSNSDNWSPAGAPVSTDDVLIPKVLTVYPTLTEDAEIKSLQIDSLATVSASTFNLTVNGYNGAWSNKGTFVPGTGTVSFTHGINNQIVSVSGNTQFYNLYFGANTYVRPGSESLIQVSGLASGEVSSIVDLSAIGNTVEFNGTDQYISNPSTVGFGFSGYYNLKISGTGTKTLVQSDRLDIAGNFINNSTIDVSTATVYFGGTAPQTISGSSVTTFNNLTVSNTTGVTSSKNITVNGILNLTDNPSISKGALDMGSNTITYGDLAINTGVGDVTGKNSRNSMVASKLYTFGNPYSNAIFAPSIGTIPSNITMDVALGTAPGWKTTAAKRIYTMTQTGNVSTKATIQMHYLDNEINGNTEELLVPWYYVYSTVFQGVSRSNYDVNNNYLTLSNVNFNFPTGTQFSLANSTTTSSIWTGVTDTDWNNPSNWFNALIPSSTSNVVIPDASTLPNNPTLATDTISSINMQSGGILNASSNAVLTLNGSSGTWNNSGGTFNPNTSTVIFANGTDATVSGTTNFYNITITSGTRLSNQAGAVIGIAGTVTNNGVWSTTSQGVSTVNYNGGAQSVVIPDASSRRYNNLILSGSGNKTMPTTPSTLLNIVGDFTMSGTASTTFVGGLNFDGNVTLGSGTFLTTGSFSHSVKGNWTNNGATVDNSGSTFDFDGTSTQTIGGTTATAFNNLTLSNSTNINVSNNLTLTGALSIPNSSTSLYLAGNLVNNGTINLSSGTVLFNGATAQTIGGSSTSTFKNVTVSNLAGLTANTDQTVNGILNLTTNPDATHGALDMGSNTLNMGVSATNIGIGDVTGIVKRQHTFTGGVVYSFGNQYTSIDFLNVSGSVKPTWISLKTSIGAAPSWNSSAIKRIYSFAQEASGTDRTITSLHYLDSELNGNTDETKLVYWDAYAGPDFTSHYPRSHTNFSTDNNWIGLTGMAINFMAPSTSLDNKQWSLGYSNVDKITWTGNGSPTYNGDWNLPGNWNGGVPTANDDVVIPAPADLPVDTHGLPTRNLLSSPAVCKSLEIKSGATLTVDNYNITVYGSTGAWLNSGTFVPGSGTVIFTNGSTSNIVSIAGTTNFNNLTVADNTQIQALTANVLRIAGTMTTGSGSIIDFTTNTNTVEYDGTSAQNVILPQSGYSSLILSGNSTKTMPSSSLSVVVDLSINGSKTVVNASNALSTGGVLTVSAGTTLDMKSYPLINLSSNSGTGTLKTQNTSLNPIPSGKTWTESVVYNGSAAQTLPVGTFANLQISNTASTVSGNGTLNTTNLTLDNGAVLDMGTNLLSSMTTNSGTGTLKTQNTSSTPIPSGVAWTGNVVYNGSDAQSVVSATYNGLQISNTTTSATASGTINSTNLTIDNGAILDMGTNLLSSMTTNSGTGTLKTQNTSSLPVPSAKIWSGTVIYNGSGVQTAVAGTFNNLTCDNSAELDLNDSVTVSGTLLINSSREMDIVAGAKMVANQITNNAGSSGLYILANSSGANGTLIFNNSGSSPVSATVGMYSKAAASVVNGSSYSQYKWQFFGIPLQSVTTNPTFAAYVGSINNGSYINKHVESGTTSSTYWVSQGNSAVLNPFAGYEITQKIAKTIYFEGQLVNSDFTQVLSYTSGAAYPGQHIFGNPYTAAIDISKLNFGSETEATAYLYNTGSHDDWATQTGVDGTAGQYVSAPKSTAGIGGVPGQIPSMQGFLLVSKSSSQNATIEIPYSSVIRNTVKQRARNTSDITTDKVYTRIDIAGTRYNDKMWIFTNPSCTRAFDNGWDGQKFLGSSLSPQLWAMEADGDYQVDAVNDINNTNLGFLSGEDSNYTLTFTHENLNQQYSALYLIDLANPNNPVITDITVSGTTYTFSADQASAPVNRFKIVTTPGIATALSNQNVDNLNIFSSLKGNVIVQNPFDSAGKIVICDLSGKPLVSESFVAKGITSISCSLTPGTYIARALTGNVNTNRKLIIR